MQASKYGTSIPNDDVAHQAVGQQLVAMHDRMVWEQTQVLVLSAGLAVLGMAFALWMFLRPGPRPTTAKAERPAE